MSDFQSESVVISCVSDELSCILKRINIPLRLVTTYGLKENLYSGTFLHTVTFDDLFV